MDNSRLTLLDSGLQPGFHLMLIMESQNAWGGKDLRDHSVPAPLTMDRNTFPTPGCSKPPPVWPWNNPRDGSSTASLGNLFQCPTTLWVKNFSPISNPNQPSVSSRAILPFVLVRIKRIHPSSLYRNLGICLSVFLGQVCASSVAATLSSAPPCSPSWGWCPWSCGAFHGQCTLS